ncbi:MAG: hypothetical protein QXP77_03400 [Candidatus Aenigmatarchaeota archaeon]
MKKIQDIDLKKDKKISIVGRVSNANEGSFVLSDGKNKIEILSDEKVNGGEILRVFCSIEGDKIKADIVQRLNDLDLNLYKEVEELYSKIGD